MIRLEAPFTEEKIRNLKVGDMVEIYGLLYTARDAVHKWLSEGNEPPRAEVDLRNAALYHCGPVVMEKGKGDKKRYTVTAAGPTTSTREEPYQAGIIEKFGIRMVIGKGGMGEKTRIACEKFGCVYLHAVGGAAQVLAEAIKEVEGVYGFEKFGSPEAIWKFRVEKFAAVVTIDAHGNSLHNEISASSGAVLQKIYSGLKK